MDIKENTGTLFNNRQWTEGSKQPRIRGEINVGGKIMEVAIWVKKSAKGNTYYSVAIKEPQTPETKKSETPVDRYPDIDDSILF